MRNHPLRSAIISLLVTATLVFAFIVIDDTHNQTVGGIKTHVFPVIGSVTFATLDANTTAADGEMQYCTDCQRNTEPCQGVGSGAMAIRRAGMWECLPGGGTCSLPTPTPLTFGTPGVIAVFNATELGSYAGAICPTPGMVSEISAAGAVTCITPTPQPTATPGAGGGGAPGGNPNDVQFQVDATTFGGNDAFTYEAPGVFPTPANAPRLTSKLFTDGALFEMDQGEFNLFADYGGANEIQGNPFLISADVTPDASGTLSGYFAGELAVIGVQASGVGASTSGFKDNALIALTLDADGSLATIPTGDIATALVSAEGSIPVSVFSIGDGVGLHGMVGIDISANGGSSGSQSIGIHSKGWNTVDRAIGAYDEGTASAGIAIGTLGSAWTGGAANIVGGYFTLGAATLQALDAAVVGEGNGANEFVGLNGGTTNFRVDAQGIVIIAPIAVGSLPTCNGGYEGARASVNDSNAVSFTAGIGAVVANGGTTHVPVYCDGTNWRIG